MFFFPWCSALYELLSVSFFYSRILMSFRKYMHYLAYGRVRIDKVWIILHCRKTSPLFCDIIKSASTESVSLQVTLSYLMPVDKYSKVTRPGFPLKGRVLRKRGLAKVRRTVLCEAWLPQQKNRISQVRAEYWEKEKLRFQFQHYWGISVIKDGAIHNLTRTDNVF